MLDDYGFETYETAPFPLAYLITFRTFGTWLHGDEKGSVGKSPTNIYGRPDIPPNPGLKDTMQRRAKQDPVILSVPQRRIVEEAIVEVCGKRSYYLKAVNARTNHVHVVVSAQIEPERMADSFKAYSTKRLKESGFEFETVWSRGRSRKYLWKPRHVEQAIHYVLYEQGDRVFEIED